MKPILSLASILAFSILSLAAAAADFSVSIIQPETIYAGNTTASSITVTNNGPNDWFSLAILGTYSSWVNADNQNIFIPSGSSASFNIKAMPAADAIGNKYEYSVIVSRASNSVKVEDKLVLSVIQSSAVVIGDITLSCYECKPGEIVVASASLRNVGSKSLANLKLVFSIGDKIKIVPIASLDPGMAKSFSAEFYVDSVTAPGKYAIDAKLMQDTLEFTKRSVQFSVPSMPNINTMKNVSSSIFGNYVIFTSTNDGNAPQTSEIKSNVLSAWYSAYSGAKPSSVSGPEYGWVVTLAPKETLTIIYSEVFWPVPLSLIALVFAGAYYYMTISSLSIRKRLLRHLSSKEISISLDVKSGLHPVDNAVVRDVVPKEFEVQRKFESIKPVTRKVPHGTELVWRLGRLKSKEERILHYKIKPILSFKTARLHPAELNGKRGNNIVSRLSNFLFVHEEPKEPQRTIKVTVAE